MKFITVLLALAVATSAMVIKVEVDVLDGVGLSKTTGSFKFLLICESCDRTVYPTVMYAIKTQIAAANTVE